MTKGILVGLLGGLLIAGGAFGIYYYFWVQDWKPPTLVWRSGGAAEGTSAVDMELARVNPSAALWKTRAEDLPEFLAFLDLDAAVTQPAIDDYRQIFERVAAYYSNDTPIQIVEAVFRIHHAGDYLYTLRYRDCLAYIQDTLPGGFNSETSDARSSKSIRTVGEEIHEYLVASYMKPQWDAMKAKEERHRETQERINANLAAARAQGEAVNAARARVIEQRNARIQRNIDREYYRYRSYGYNNTLRSWWDWR